MPLPLSSDLAKALLAKRDPKLTKALASEILAQVEPLVVARYLLTPEVAVDLLGQRLEKEPEATLHELEALARKSGKTAAHGQPRAGVTKPRAKSAPKAQGKRVRLSAAELDALKDEVRSYLKTHSWSTRGQIIKAAELPTTSIYNRVMADLRASGEVVAKGEKAGRVYGLKGSGSSKAKATPKKATKSSTKRARPARSLPKLCPVPGCKGKAAPVFGMMCREHKDLSKAERDRLFATRRARSEG